MKHQSWMQQQEGTSTGILHERRKKRRRIVMESARSKCFVKQAVLESTNRKSVPKFLLDRDNLSKREKER
jgi:hypothetical protein